MSIADPHGQTSPLYRATANREKALNTLFGICRGLTADRQLNDREVAYLTTWLSESESLVYGDPDFFDISCQLKDILADGRITVEEMDDFREMLDGIAEHRPTSRFVTTDAVMQHLTGIIHGVVADHHLHDNEIRALSAWLEENKALEKEWPANRIFQRVRSVLADDVVTEEERADLLDTLVSLNGRPLEEVATVGGQSTCLFMAEMPVSDLAFDQRTFLLTGKFVFGPRSKCQEAIASRGGMISNALTKKTDYLVVGSLSSRDWINESFGLKIRGAMEMRDKGHHILILDEERWSQSFR